MHGSQEALGMLSPMDGAADKLLKGDLGGAGNEAMLEAFGGRVFKAAGKGMAAVKRHAGQLDEAVGALSHADDAATATATGVRESIEEASSVLAKEGGGAVNSAPRLSPTNYPNPDPPMSAPGVRYEPTTIDEVVRMRQGKGPTTQATHGTGNIEAHHRQQVPTSQGGVLDELTQQTHRGPGNHTRHSQPSQLTPAQRAKEIRDHWKQRGSDYILPGEGL